MNAVRTYKSALMLTVFCAFIFLTKLGTLGLWEPDESRYAEIPREMIEHNDFIVPRLNGLPYLDKPPLYYWIVAGSYSLFGVSEFTARLPNAFIAYLTVLMLFLLTKKMFDERTALFSGLILSSSLLFYGLSHAVLTDLLLTSIITLSMSALYWAYSRPSRKNITFPLVGIALGIGILAKGPVAIIIPGCAFFLFLFIQKNLTFLLSRHLITALLLFTAVILPWYILVSLREPWFIHYFFYEQNLKGFIDGEVHHPHAFYMSLPFLMGALFPWSIQLLCLFALIPYRGLLNNLREHREVCLLVCWAGFTFLLFTISKSKLMTYYLPALPPLAILLVRGWINLPSFATKKRITIVHVCGIVFVALVAIATPFFAYFHPKLANYTSAAASGALIVVGITVLLVAVTLMLSFISIIKNRWHYGVITLSVTIPFILLFIIIPFLRPIESVRSSRELIQDLTSELRDDDILVSYHAIASQLIFYAHRQVLVSGKLGEYAPALAQLSEEEKRQYFISEQDLVSLLQSNQRVIVYIQSDREKRLKKGPRDTSNQVLVAMQQALLQTHVLATNGTHTILTNKER